MKLRCLLIDDEPPALKVLDTYISQLNGLEILVRCKNALEALDALENKTVDLMVPDIKMPHILGTHFSTNLFHPPKEIFVTAYHNHALDGYELDAIDFLVKPVSLERFVQAITKVKRMMGQETVSPLNNNKSNTEAFMYLKADRIMQKIYVNDILYIERWRNYIKVFLTTGKNFLVKQSISALEKLLSDHKFLRVHRSFIVSVDKITGYNALSVQVNVTDIPIGRLHKKAVMEPFNMNNDV